MPTDQYLEVYVSGQKDNVDVCHVLCVIYPFDGGSSLPGEEDPQS